MVAFRLSDIVEEGDRRPDTLVAAEAGLAGGSSARPTPVDTPRMDRKNPDQKRADKEAESEKLRDFTKGAFTSCRFS